MGVAQELPIVGGTRLREFGVEVAAAQRGRSLDEEEILGGKEDHRQDADEVALPQVLPAALDAPPRAARKGKGKRPGDIVPQETERNVRPRRSHTNKLRIARGAMGASERGVVKRLDDIRLALCVRAEEDLHASVEGE